MTTFAPLSIMQVVEECKEGNIDLVSSTKMDGGVPVTRWFWNRKGQKGSLNIQVGDVTKPQTSWPFLLKEPSKHPDAADDITSKGAFTAVPDPEEKEAWLWFREWIVQRVHAKGVVKGKKGETLESVRSEVAELGIAPEDDSHHFCFSQKLQMKGTGKWNDLSTKFITIIESTGPKGEKKYSQGPDFDGNSLKASNNIFSTMELGELKRNQGKWRSVLYTRIVMKIAEPDVQADTKTVSIGGISFRIGGEGDAESGAVAGADPAATTSSSVVSGSADHSGLADHSAADDTATFGDAVLADVNRLTSESLKRPPAGDDEGLETDAKRARA